MKYSILFIFLAAWGLTTSSQIPKGRYFEEIGGTIWRSSESIDQATLRDLKEFGLSIIEIGVDSLKTNTTLWTFDEILKIESYNTVTKERKALVYCKYEHDREKKFLRLFVDDLEFEYSYVPISTGAYVGFKRIE